jgi:hypothetical protein
MTLSQDYLKNAEECEHAAGSCVSERNRDILLSAAAQWRKLAAQTGGPDSLPANAHTVSPTRSKPR